VCRASRAWVGHGPDEVVQAAGVAGEACAHLSDHLAGDGIGCEAGWGRGGQLQAGPALGEGLAVVGVEVPGAARGLGLALARGCGLHQHAGALAHPAVEKLHAQLLLAARPLGEFGTAAQEMRVVDQAQGQVQLGAQGFQALRQPPFAGFQHGQAGGAFALRAPALDQGTQAIDQAGQVREPCIAQLHMGVGLGPGRAGHGRAELPHGRDEHGDAGRVAPHVGGLARGLDQQGVVECRVVLAQQRVVWRELVAQDEQQVSHGGVGGAPRGAHRKGQGRSGGAGCGAGVAFAAFTAIAHFVPAARPGLAPGHGALAVLARLVRQVGFQAPHGGASGVRHGAVGCTQGRGCP